MFKLHTFEATISVGIVEFQIFFLRHNRINVQCHNVSVYAGILGESFCATPLIGWNLSRDLKSELDLISKTRPDLAQLWDVCVSSKKRENPKKFCDFHQQNSNFYGVEANKGD